MERLIGPRFAFYPHPMALLPPSVFLNLTSAFET